MVRQSLTEIPRGWVSGPRAMPGPAGCCRGDAGHRDGACSGSYYSGVGPPASRRAARTVTPREQLPGVRSHESAISESLRARRPPPAGPPAHTQRLARDPT